MNANLNITKNGSRNKLEIRKFTIRFSPEIESEKTPVKLTIISMSNKTIKLDNKTENIILLFFFEVLVLLETTSMSFISNLKLFTFLTILCKKIKEVNNS